MARKKPASAPSPATPTNDSPAIYTLDVFIIQGLVTAAFARKNPVVRRTIEIRSDQTLADPHRAIFAAFDREEEHLYEFQFGKRPMDPKGTRYVLSRTDDALDGGAQIGGVVTRTTIASLHLKVGDRFSYWFDFGDDWWHQINVEKIEPGSPEGTYPRVVSQVGESPPQYPDLNGEDDEEDAAPEKPKKAKKPKKAAKPRRKKPSDRA